MRKFLKVLKIIFLSLLVLIAVSVGGFLGWFYIPRLFPSKVTLHKDAWRTNYPYVFVHGLAGWGSYDEQYKSMPYWGMMNGDLMTFLNKQGFDCYAASVAPSGSAWDRACELYAQLTGTRVDYGKAHSEAMGHERYGKDFSTQPLIENWNAKNKISLLGHSFGGATVRLFVSLMTQGDESEIVATNTDDISDFFTGGKSDWVYSVTMLAAPNNGTSAYHADNEVEVPKFDRKMSSLMSGGLAVERDSRSEKDYASYDMNIDNAIALNNSLALPNHIYYFSYPCECTKQNEDGTYSPIRSKMEFFYRMDSERLGHYTGVTSGGFVIDDSWQQNDGLVNTVSAMYPLGQPHKDFDKSKIERGIWQVMPVQHGDHMSLQGGMLKRKDVRGLYMELLDMVNGISDSFASD